MYPNEPMKLIESKSKLYVCSVRSFYFKINININDVQEPSYQYP